MASSPEAREDVKPIDQLAHDLELTDDMWKHFIVHRPIKKENTQADLQEISLSFPPQKKNPHCGFKEEMEKTDQGFQLGVLFESLWVFKNLQKTLQAETPRRFCLKEKKENDFSSPLSPSRELEDAPPGRWHRSWWGIRLTLFDGGSSQGAPPFIGFFQGKWADRVVMLRFSMFYWFFGSPSGWNGRFWGGGPVVFWRILLVFFFFVWCLDVWCFVFFVTVVVSQQGWITLLGHHMVLSLKRLNIGCSLLPGLWPTAMFSCRACFVDHVSFFPAQKTWSKSKQRPNYFVLRLEAKKT